MEDCPLTLKDFTFVKTKVDVEEIKKFDSENRFMFLAVELFKEVCEITSVLSCTYRYDKKNNPRKWNRNEAILGGLMVRTVKLQIAVLNQTCQERSEIMYILFRCLGESLINLRYLLEKNSNDLYDEYIEYSLRTEKRLLNKINQKIKERGTELPIERRMKISIDRAFKTSSFSPEEVDETAREPWGETIRKRAENIKWEEEYFALFSLLSHTVHGNWQDLITHHLEYENGKFSPRIEWEPSRPQPLFAAALLSAEVNKLFLDKIIPACPDKDRINKMLEDVLSRIKLADRLHEQFLQKEGNGA